MTLAPETVLQDLRYGWRMLLKHPGFTAVALVTLGIGIGANTAIFSVINAVLLRPLPFHDPKSLCLLTERLRDVPVVGPSFQNFVDWRAQNHSFQAVVGAHTATFTLTGAGEPERVQGQMASASLFPVLGVSAVEGHTFLPQEDRVGAAPVALISYGFWKQHFAGGQVLGKTITLDNQPYTVVGVLPAGFQLVQPVDVIVPFEPWTKTLPDDRSWHPGIIAIGRLKAGVSIESARAEINNIAKRLERQYPVYDTDVNTNVSPMQELLVENVRPALLILLGAVGMLLLIACANVANLLLVRATSRRREIAVRAAMGAGHFRIVRQLLTESVLLGFAGGLVGFGLAWVCMPLLERLASENIRNLGTIELDSPVLLFGMVVVLLSGILFGLAPALHTVTLDLRAMLNEAARGTTGSGRQSGMRSALVVSEIALALVLLLGATLLLRSFAHLANVQPGFQANNLLVADVPVSPRAHKQSAERMAFFDRLLERARLIPGVRAAGAAAILPVSGGGTVIHFNIQGRAPKTAHEYIAVGYRPVSPEYLATLRVPLIEGRLLTDADTERSPFVVVVNRAMARRFFPHEPALGKRVQLGALPNHEVPFMQIVGIVGDMKQNLATDAQAEMYLPYRQADTMLPIFALSLVLRTANDPRKEISGLRRVVRQLDPDQPLVQIRTMQENISTSEAEPRFRTILLAIFAGAALLLSIVGLYGVMTYSVTQRVQEIGIRMTLGAGKAEVLKMITGQGLRLALGGVGAGLCGAFLLSRVLTKFLYGISATDPLTYVVVAVLLIAIAVAACYFPAWRATRVDPMTALRHE